METSSLLEQLPFSTPARLPPPPNTTPLPSRVKTPHQEYSTPNGDWNKLFEERPMDPGELAAWLSDLEKKRGEEWYENFVTWYLRKLYHPRRRNAPMSNAIFESNLMKLEWDPENTEMRDVTERLACASFSTTPDFLLGQYNGHTVGLVLDGSALDPPTVGIETFDLLGVQYAHLHMFVGLRVQEPAMDDLCLLTLGKSPVLAARSMNLANTWQQVTSMLQLRELLRKIHRPQASLALERWVKISTGLIQDTSWL